MKSLICLLLLMIVSAGITLTSLYFEWSPLVYLLTSITMGGILGYISGKAGYEA